MQDRPSSLEVAVTEQFDGGWEEAYAQHEASSLWSDDAIPCVAAAIDELTRRQSRTVLDIGCGDGRNLQRLVAAGFVCTGLDVSPTGLRRAADRLAGSAFLVHGDATSLEMFPDSSIDAITCFDVAGQIPDTKAMISSFALALRPGGVAILNAFTPQDSEYGNGTPIGRHTFSYKSTLFRFFEEEDIRLLFDGWEISKLYRQSWVDPPHGEFRPYEHTHDNWIVIASTGAAGGDRTSGA